MVDDEMYIAGMESQSMVDEPGHVVAMIYLQGCGFSCGFCHNSPLIPMPTPASKKTSLDDLMEVLEGNFLIDGVVFTGGEPTLQPALPAFIEAMHDRYKVVCLDTNGTNPTMIEQVSPNLTRIAMDIKASLDRYDDVVGKSVNIEKIEKSISLLCHRSMDVGRVEFRTVYAYPRVTLDDILAIARMIRGAGFSGNFRSFFVIQQYMPSDGVREECKDDYQVATVDQLEAIAEYVKDIGIPVAIRCQERGYFEI